MAQTNAQPNLRIVKTPEQATQAKIFAVLKLLRELPKTSVDSVMKDGTIETITVMHEQQFVPNFRLEWCTRKSHYRVYILVAGTTFDKEKAGYPICTIRSGLNAIGFATMYRFLHANRAGNKTSE